MTNVLLIIIAILLLILTVTSIVICVSTTKIAKSEKIVKDILKRIIIIISIVGVIGLAIGVTTFKQSESKEFTKITLSEYLKLNNDSKKSIVLVARPTCAYCAKFTPVLKKVMNELDIVVNYINTDEFSSEDWEVFNNSNDYLKNTKWGTPLVMIVQNGSVIAVNEGYVEQDAIKNFFIDNGFGGK